MYVTITQLANIAVSMKHRLAEYIGKQKVINSLVEWMEYSRLPVRRVPYKCLGRRNAGKSKGQQM
jgi:hypothetical protein